MLHFWNIASLSPFWSVCPAIGIWLLLNPTPAAVSALTKLFRSHKSWWKFIPIIFLSLADQPPGLSVHDWGPGPGFFPAVVVFHQTWDQLVWELWTNAGIKQKNWNTETVLTKCVHSVLWSRGPSPSAGFGGSSCHESWRPAQRELYPPLSIRQGRGWS